MPRPGFFSRTSRHLIFPVLLDFTNLEKPYGYYFEGLRAAHRPPLSEWPSPRLQPVSGPGGKESWPHLCQNHFLQQPGFYPPQPRNPPGYLPQPRLPAGTTDTPDLRPGFDDEKNFVFITDLGEEFVIRLYHDWILLIPKGKKWVERRLEEVIVLFAWKPPSK